MCRLSELRAKILIWLCLRSVTRQLIRLLRLWHHQPR